MIPFTQSVSISGKAYAAKWMHSSVSISGASNANALCEWTLRGINESELKIIYQINKGRKMEAGTQVQW